MTVCIAAIAGSPPDNEYVVTACDRMVATQDMSADAVATKSHFIAQDWGLMWSAEDASYVTPIWRMTQSALYEDRLHVHCDQVAGTVAKAYQRQLQEEATAKYLARYGLSMERFLTDGARLFPQAQYEEMHREIRAVRLGCDFLGFGFDDQAHIFRVSDPGKITYEDEVGFAAIGSGWYSAISTLFFHSVNRAMELWEVVYHVLEAKFMAESAPGVGSETFAEISSLDGNVVYLVGDAIDQIRDLWWRSGMPRVPRRAEEKVTSIIEVCKEACAEMDKEVKVDIEKRRDKFRKLGEERDRKKQADEEAAS